MKKVLILVGSNGKNAELAEQIHEASKKIGNETSTIKLVDLDLPLYTPVAEGKGIPNKAIELSEKIIAADSLVVISPEYNGSMAPTINNAIAWVSRSGDDWRGAFNGKPTLIATHSGGGGSHVLMAMRQQLSYVGANVLGRQLLTNFSKSLSSESLDSCLKQL